MSCVTKMKFLHFTWSTCITHSLTHSQSIAVNSPGLCLLLLLIPPPTLPLRSLPLRLNTFLPICAVHGLLNLDRKSQAVENIVIPPESLYNDSLPSVLDAIMAQYFPTLSLEAQFEALWIFRLFRNFSSLDSRCTCLRVRFLSICALGNLSLWTGYRLYIYIRCNVYFVVSFLVCFFEFFWFGFYIDSTVIQD